MNEKLIQELRSIEMFADELRQRCYKARITLEGFYPSGSQKKERKRPLSPAQVADLIATRRKNALRKKE